MRLLLVALCLVGSTWATAVPFRKHAVPTRAGHAFRSADPLYGGVNSSMLFVVVAQFEYQYFSLQVDTGSSGTSVPLLSCRNDKNFPCQSPSLGLVGAQCKPCDLAFSMAGRCSVSDLGVCCTHHLGYADKSHIEGPLVTGTFRLGERQADHFSLLGASGRGGMASNIMDGIMGLSFPALDPLAGSDALSSLDSSSFSFCGGTEGGYLVVSEDEDKLLQFGDGPTVTVPLDRSNNYYGVSLNMLTFEGRPLGSLSYAGQRCIVDSGTTYLLVEQPYYMALRALAFSDYGHLPGFSEKHSLFVPFTDGQCLPRSLFTAPWSAYPNLTVTFANGVALNITAASYLYEHGDACVFLGIGMCANCGVVLGDTFMRQHVSVFDRAASQMRFAPVHASCASPSRLAPKLSFAHNQTQLLVGRWNALQLQLTPPPAIGALSDWTLLSGGALFSSRVPVGPSGLATLYVQPNVSGVPVKFRVTVDDAELTAEWSVVDEGPAPDPTRTIEQPAMVFGVGTASVLLGSLLFILSYVAQVRRHARENQLDNE